MAGLDTVQPVLVVFFLPSTSDDTALCTHGGHHLLQLVLVVFFLVALYIAHLLMCTQTNKHTCTV